MPTPKKIRLRKRFQRRRFGARARGAKNPMRMAAAIGRRRVRRRR